MSRGTLILLAAALGLGLFVWLVEIPSEQKRVESETAEKKLVDFKESDVQAVTLHSPAGDIEVARDSAGTWVILKPRKLTADQQAVEELLRTLQLAKISRVVDESGTDLQSYGLASPSLTISVRLVSGTQTLRLGDPGPLSSSLYVLRENSPKVLLTTLSGRDLLSKSVQDFRRKRVVQFDRDRVTRLKVTTSGKPVVLYREGQGEKSVWTIKSPVETAADQPEVRSLLFALEDLKALSFLDDPKDRQAKLAALGKPFAAFLIHEGDTEGALTLYQDPRDKTAAYAAASGQDALVRIAPAAARDLTKGLFALRNKQLIAGEPDRVKTLVIKKDGQEYSLTHEGSDWLVDGDPGAKADAARLNMFVTRVVRLQAERIVTDKPSDLKPYGLTAPAAELIAADAQGKLLGRIALGRQQEGLAYALGSAMPGVFQVRPDILNEIPKKAELLVTKSQLQGGKGGK
jgi:hypothetical protein